MARHFDPATFWDEVRRYGVTVGTYTWTMLRDLVEAVKETGKKGKVVVTLEVSPMKNNDRVVVIGDLFEVVPALIAALKA